ncbi:ParB/RepB/Spo0J family partition protein [Demequina sp. TTPB684]|uniref:ParB/RepB/Spo0J family partition protein n=1 Tax=unclassified Demequina TaxID=2620311 RepID=UPI001CF4630F|nr:MULTISPECIES: ParB/RepB/Spo0J family partition protein [unclassified Demequina]MCB2413676.1 ParB/RepB/Spo0J family partition protein [Demequina sp. TTPB684]UPU87738.1 ParB/RepB/Spo0J family partition protein [Demequina sp. TMPB413]
MATKRTPVKAVDKTAASSKAMDSLAAGTTLVHEIPIDRIDPHPRNPRRDVGELGELAESIRAHGVKQPATVVPHPTDEGRYLTVAGHRRIAASLVAGRTTVPALVDEDMDETEQLEVMLVENLQRIDLTISEEGDGYQGLLDLGVSKATIVRRTGRAKNTVDTRLRIAGMPEPVRRHVDHHQLTIEDALHFADWKDAHPDVWQDNLAKLMNPHVMVDVVMGEARRVVSEREALEKAKTDLQAAGYKLVVTHETAGYNDPRSIARMGISRDEHAHCPGAEIHITGTSKAWCENALSWGSHMCAEPEKHHPEAFAGVNVDPDRQAEIDKQREEHAARLAEFAAARAAIETANTDRRQWLLHTLTAQGVETAPTYAALAAVAVDVARALLLRDGDEHDTYLLWEASPSDALPEDAVLPENHFALLTLSTLLTLDGPLGGYLGSSQHDLTLVDVGLVVLYLRTLSEHGHKLHDLEQQMLSSGVDRLATETTETTENDEDVDPEGDAELHEDERFDDVDDADPGDE